MLLNLPTELHYIVSYSLSYLDISNLRLTAKLLARRLLNQKFWEDKGKLDFRSVSFPGKSFFDFVDIADSRERYFLLWKKLFNREPRRAFTSQLCLNTSSQSMRISKLWTVSCQVKFPVCQEMAGEYFSDLIGALATTGEIQRYTEADLENYLTNISHFEILFAVIVECFGNRFKKLHLKHPIYWVEPCMIGYYGKYRFEFTPATAADFEDLKVWHCFYDELKIGIYWDLSCLLTFDLTYHELNRLHLALDCLDYSWSLDKVSLRPEELETIIATGLNYRPK